MTRRNGAMGAIIDGSYYGPTILIVIPLTKDKEFVKRAKGKPALPVDVLVKYLVQAIELKKSARSKLMQTESNGKPPDMLVWYAIGDNSDFKIIRETCAVIFKEFGVKGDVARFD